MKNVFRGAALLSLFSLCVVLIYAQKKTGAALATASDAPEKVEINSVETALLDNTVIDKKDDTKKLVKTTASVKAAGAGISRGAFSATAYCLSGRTAMGHGVRRGIIAADPRVLKLGSKVTINAGPYSGTYLVSDTGGAIKGKKIDIWVPNCSEARRFGRRSVQIFQ